MEKPASASATLDEQKTRIQILNGSGVPGQADKIKVFFTQAGFTSVQTGNATGVTQAQTQVVFSKQLNSVTRDKIVSVLKTQFPSITSRESTDTAFDAVITTVRLPTATPAQ